MNDQFNKEQSYENLKESATLLNKLWQENFVAIGKNAFLAMQANNQFMVDITAIYQKWLSKITLSPLKILEAQTTWWKDYLSLCENLTAIWSGKETIPFIDPLHLDRRFKGFDWSDKPIFQFMQQSYLLFCKHCLHFIENNPSSDARLNKQVYFFTKQFLDALSPSNFILTNPEVLQQTLAANGENLSKGMQNFLDDLIKGQGHAYIKMTDMNAFVVGEDVAVTKGKVVFKNKMMELIQYTATTKEVYTTPLLIIPPWINKYYILDLTQKNSFIKWCVDQGYTVFMISWVNPDASYRDTSFAEYLNDGFLAALKCVQEITGEKQINALGFCIGGTLLACALAYLNAKKEESIKSATFLTSLIDFAEPGDIEVFIDENWVNDIEKQMAQDGYLDGRVLMGSFNMLRSNDLWWAYYINNYLCGKNPFPFDLLYWNSDSTNLPAKMHSEYLRQFYLENRLCHPGKLTLLGEKLDLTKVKVPSYFLSTEKDHIAPWESTYYGAKCLGGEVTFVLGESGHIAGVINPPQNAKYGFRIGKSQKLQASPNQWLEKTTRHEGSWWEHWHQWLVQNSGKEIAARKTDSSKYKSISDAPGSYVKKRLV